MKSVLAAALLSLMAPLAAHAAEPRLFADSQLVTQPRFSDEIVGKGPDVIFIHGLASSRETWKATAERLKGKYRVHLIQVAGMAGEPARDNAKGKVLEPTAEAIDAYLVAGHLTPATLVGHSMGGTMSLYLAEQHPDHYKKILVVDAVPSFARVMMPGGDAEKVRPMAEQIRAGASAMPDAQRDRMIAGMVTGPADRTMVSGWGKVSDNGVVANAMADDLELDLAPGLAKATPAITVLYPDNAAVGANGAMMDSVYPPAFAALPHGKTQRIDGSLHFIMLDQPAKFAAALDAFLAQ